MQSLAAAQHQPVTSERLINLDEVERITGFFLYLLPNSETTIPPAGKDWHGQPLAGKSGSAMDS